MNDEIKESAIYTSGAVLIVLIICAALIGGCREWNRHDEEMAKAGMVEKQCIGTSGTIWTKP